MQRATATTSSADLDPVLHRAAFAVLNDRAFLRITGPEATRWLNGMVTNSVQALAPGEGNYNFLLNAQGRIQGDCTIYRDPSAAEPVFLLETAAEQLQAIQAHLDRFIIMDDVELTPALEGTSTLLLLGPEAPRHLAGLGLPAPEPLRLAQAETPSGPIHLLTPAPTQVPRFEVQAAAPVIQAIAATLAAMGLPEATPTTLEQLRVLEATPRFGTDIRDRELPHETNQAHALHFAKGCYLGQEIVERVRSRGQVHRVFTAFRLEGSLPGLPAPLEADGKAVGELTSAAPVLLPEGQTILALGYARREILDAGAPLIYPGGIAHRRDPRRAMN